MCLNKGYDYPEIEIEATKEDTCHIFVRGVEKELIKIGYATKRWVVERTNA
ncbi:MAG TPA: hypothetical protein VIW25_05635 [Nitrososphaeraceae archaeon]